MIEDARRIPEGSHWEADICIVGAGPAGLTLARHFANSPVKVVLLESGGLDFEWWPQNLSRGVLVGDPYEPLHICRVRQFGGTTHRAGWGGWCKPLVPRDFAARSWVPSSGWPISYEDLASYYPEAARQLNLPAQFSWAARPLPGDDGSELWSEPCALTPTPQQGTAAYEELLNAPNVRVLLHATAGRLALADDSDAIGHLPVYRHDRRQFCVRAQYFVLAAGAIENARMLLASNERWPAGIGNQHDLVGRYFMEHPHVRWGHFVAPNSAAFVALHNPRVAQQALARGLTNPSHQVSVAGLVVDPAVQERRRILSSRSWIKPVGAAGFGPATQALQDITFWFRKGRIPPHLLSGIGAIASNGHEVTDAIITRLFPRKDEHCFFDIDTIVEQEPQFGNRVTLDSARDRFGMPRARLEWRISPLVQKTIDETKEIIKNAILDIGLAEIPARSDGKSSVPAPSEQVRCVRHHIGTTRMGASEKYGVVDADCRVFGVPNLYVAGSSVFPTGGNDMPTMTIVALSRRLGDHLGSLLNSRRRASGHGAACGGAGELARSVAAARSATGRSGRDP